VRIALSVLPRLAPKSSGPASFIMLGATRLHVFNRSGRLPGGLGIGSSVGAALGRRSETRTHSGVTQFMLACTVRWAAMPGELVPSADFYPSFRPRA